MAGSTGDDRESAQVRTAELGRMAGALDVLDRHAELNHRYRKLLHESREVLAAERIRLTQARGVAKRLMVLARAARPELPEDLGPGQRAALQDGLSQADELVYRR